MRMVRKTWVAAGAVVLATLGAVAPAHAVAPRVEGTFPIHVMGCAVSEEIELQGSPAHDYMRWETHGPSSGCHVEIERNGTTIEQQNITDDAYHRSDWYYDGPGDTAEVCVSTFNDAACGPGN